MLINKYTLRTSECQESEINFSVSPLGFIGIKVFDSTINIFNLLFSFNLKYKSTYASQSSLGRMAGGYDRRTVNEETEKLHRFGFIFKHKRPGQKTCEYFVNGFFLTSAGRMILIIIFNITFQFLNSVSHPTQLILTNVTKNEIAEPKFHIDDADVPQFLYKKSSGTAANRTTAITAAGGEGVLVFPHAVRNTRQLHSIPPVIASEYSHNSFNIEMLEAGCQPVKRLSLEEMDEIFYGSRDSEVGRSVAFLEKDLNINKQNTLNGIIKPDLVNTKDLHMLMFTESEIKQLSIYSEEAIERANQRLAEVTKKGLAPVDTFKWFKTICATWVPGEGAKKQNKTPKAGYAKPKQQTVAAPVEYESDHESVRDTLNDRKDKIRMKAEAMGIDIHAGYTTEELRMMIKGYSVLPIKSVNSVRMVTNDKQLGETPIEWCLAVEPKLHQFTIDKNPGLAMTKPYADIMFGKLTPEEQAMVMALSHPDCECRIPVSVVKVESVPKRHDLLKNQPIVKHSDMAKWCVQIEPADTCLDIASDNIPLFSSDAAPDAPEYEFTDAEYENPFPLMEY